MKVVFLFSLFISSAAFAQSIVPSYLEKIGADKNPAIECARSHGLYVKDLDYNLKKLNACILVKAQAFSKQNLVDFGEKAMETTTEGKEKALTILECISKENSLKMKFNCIIPQKFIFWQ